MSISKNKELQKLREKVKHGGGEQALEKQMALGKLSARERIIDLLDNDSFQEYDMFVQNTNAVFEGDRKEILGDGVITGTGTINGMPVCIYAQDFTVAGGSLGMMHAKKIIKIMDRALKMRVPLIGINDSGGARIQEGINSLAGYGEIFYRNTMASGIIPQISVVLGPCAGGAVYSPALTDFVFVVDKISKMFITGPEVIRTVLGEKISAEDLGGAKVQSQISGNAHFFAQSELECFDQIKRLLQYIPQNNRVKASTADPLPPRRNDIENIVPQDPREAYDVRHIIECIADNSDFMEVRSGFAPNAVVGFGRISGESTAFVANQPDVMAGVLDVDSSDKISAFVRFCDAFNIPIVTLVDLPGYLPGVDQEHAGIIRHGAKILYAYSEATVPTVTVILRKAYGGGYIAMNSIHLGADSVFAWPDAEISVMGPESAVNVVFRKELMAAEKPEEVRQHKVQEYKKKFASPYVAAGMGYVDAVIEPSETRTMIAHALKVSQGKTKAMPEKKHGLIPM